MSTIEQIVGIARHVASQALDQPADLQVVATAETDWQGEPSLRVAIILPDEAFAAEGIGDKLSDMSVSIREDLLKQGEARFPYVSFAARSEMPIDR